MLARCGPTLDQSFPSTFGSSAMAIRKAGGVKERSRVEQFEGIRRDSRDRGMSIRALAERHGVHRRTVRQALADATPPARKVPERSAPATGLMLILFGGG